MKRREFFKKTGAVSGASAGLFGNPTWTPWFFFNPENKLNPEATSEIDNLGKWSEENFTYQKDPLWGIADVSRDVEWIVENKKGDCVDHTTLALSWLINEGYSNVYIVCAYDGGFNAHMTAAVNNFAYDTHGLEVLDNYKNGFFKKRKIDIDKV